MHTVTPFRGSNTAKKPPEKSTKKKKKDDSSGSVPNCYTCTVLMDHLIGS
ncbi:hypothetical protein A2U01_0031722, partial [Trifolium medium]|nr:hypothetical protein [Trifolium medium]